MFEAGINVHRACDQLLLALDISNQSFLAKIKN